MPQSSSATVSTDRPQRYGKQLVSHLSRRATGHWEDDLSTGELDFTGGRAELSCRPGALVMRLTAEPEDLERLEGVLGRHLVRFGTRDELVVQWARQDGSAGTRQSQVED